MKKDYLFKLLIIIAFLFSSSVLGEKQANKRVDYHYKYQPMLDNLISKHIPGAVLLVESKNGRYIGSAGFKDLEKRG